MARDSIETEKEDAGSGIDKPLRPCLAQEIVDAIKNRFQKLSAPSQDVTRKD